MPLTRQVLEGDLGFPQALAARYLDAVRQPAPAGGAHATTD
jgi:hypothetical protein